MHRYKTLNPIDWEEYFEQKSNDGVFILDFEIDAGFSFATAVAHEKMMASPAPVPLDHTLEIPELVLDLACPLKPSQIYLKSVVIKSMLRPTYEATDKYAVTANFTLSKIEFGKIEKEVSRRRKEKPEIPIQSFITVCMVDYFQERANFLKDIIISHIELSGYFAKFTPSSLFLYLQTEHGNFRVLQQGGGHDSAGHHPLHPTSITKELVVKNHEWFSSVPSNIKRHYQKGVHYKFLGFYDESYLCFYKLIESAFKTDKFLDQVTSVLFEIDSKQLRETLNSSNQRMMMLFIYQTLIKTNSDIQEEEKTIIMTKMLDASKIRNDIAHSSDQTEKSKVMLQFIMSLSELMLQNIR